MRIANTTEHYGLLSKLLHWSIAAGILGSIALGWYMVGLTYYDRWYTASLDYHRAVGLVVLAVAALFVGWQHFSPPPGPHGNPPPWQRRAALVNRWLLTAMMFILPVSGYLVSTSAGDPLWFFGVAEVPALIPVGEGLRDIAVEVHYYLAYGTLVLVGLHAGAAIKHQLINRDGTLARMIWR